MLKRSYARNESRAPSFIKVGISFITVASLAWFGFFSLDLNGLLPESTGKIISPEGMGLAEKRLSNISITEKITSFFGEIKRSSTEKKYNAELEKAVSSSLSGSEGNYAVVVKNLRTGGSYYLNESKVFDIGSLYKLWVLATALEMVEMGELSLDETLSASVASLNEKNGIDPAFAELKDGYVSLTVKQAFEQMITISHNYASYLLLDRISNQKVKEFLSKNGFASSSFVDPPSATAKEVALFLERLYNADLIGENGSKEMIEVLKRQKLNEKLPKNLPEGTVIAHKTGEIGYFSHDVGIVFIEKGDYIIVVLSESKHPPGANARISTISKNVFDYFTNRKIN